MDWDLLRQGFVTFAWLFFTKERKNRNCGASEFISNILLSLSNYY